MEHLSQFAPDIPELFPALLVGFIGFGVLCTLLALLFAGVAK